MQIKIPLPLVRASNRIGDWMNKTIWRQGRFDFRYVDAWVLVAGLLNVYWGWWQGGALGALQYGLMYILVCMCALWFF